MNYREPLPEGCPPAEAEEITAARVVFRITKSVPPSEGDFDSYRKQKPASQLPVPECLLRGLSVYTRKSDLERTLKLPKFRGCFVSSVLLESGAGHLQQTGQPSHHTWWPLAEYDILGRCNSENV